MDFGFEINVSVNLPNPVRYAYDLIHDYVWEGDDEESDVG
jgi:hypothetical protein